MFEYKKVTDITDAFSVNMKGYNLPSLLKREDTKKQNALITGKLITLFGGPNRMGTDIDCLYTYYIGMYYEGTDEMVAPIIISFDRNGITISALEGGFGTGSMLDLVSEIRSTIPSSYEIKCTNKKISADIIMGVKNGVAYYETVYNRK